MNNYSKCSFSITIPSKTFLLGEYIALLGGPSLLLNTPHYFVLNFNKQNTSNFLKEIQKKKGHPGSLLLKEYKDSLTKKEQVVFNDFAKYFSFKDPYLSSGGFGCSGAEFLSVYFILQLYKIFNFQNNFTQNQIIKKWNSFIFKEKKSFSVFYKFKNLTSLGSGFDILSQLFGSIVYLEESKPLSVEPLELSNGIKHQEFSWPFIDCEFSLLKSKNKIETHKHLSELSPQQLKIIGEALSPIVKKAIIAFKKNAITDFLKSVTEQQVLLTSKGLVCLESIQALKIISKIPEVLASKSCGALGADTFLIFYSKGSKQLVKDKVKTSKGLSSLVWIKDSSLAEGVNLKFH